MFRKISATLIFLTVAAALAFGAKTVFIDGTPSLGIKGTKVTAEFLNKTSYNVPTGEDIEGSSPLLYGADTGAANAYVVNFTQGKKRAIGTNTSTATNKLIDSGATFQTAGVVIGDVVLNVTDKTSATVSVIDSQTQLSLSSNIFTATSKAYAVGPNIQQLPQAYTAGLAVSFKAANANTGPSTININGLGVKTIKNASTDLNGSTDLLAGAIPANALIAIIYDGTNFQLQGGLNYSLFSISLGPWTTSTLPASTSYQTVAYGNARFVAVVSATGTAAAYSDNGATWTASTLPSSQAWWAVAYGNGRFVAVGGNPGTGSAYSTDGGATWTAGGAMPSSQSWRSVVYGNGRFVAISYNVSSGGTAAAYSTNGGVSWTSATLPTSAFWYSVAYGNGRFVAVSGAATAAAYSTDDGSTWNASTLPSSKHWYGVSFGNGRFATVSGIGGGGSTAAAYSTDGSSWTASTLPSLVEWYSITYGNGRFVAMAGSGTVGTAISTDGGTTWTAGPPQPAGTWYSVVHGNGRWIEVGSAGLGAYAITTLSPQQ